MATFTLTTARSYSSVGMSGSCNGSLNGKTYTITSVTADCTVIALFAKTDVTFNEDNYLVANPDVASAVHVGYFQNKEVKIMAQAENRTNEGLI